MNFQLKLVISPRVDLIVCSYHVTYALRVNLFSVISRIPKTSLLKTGAISEISQTTRGFDPTLASQTNTQSFSKTFIYKLSGSEFESRCSELVITEQSAFKVLHYITKHRAYLVNRSVNYAELC